MADRNTSHDAAEIHNTPAPDEGAASTSTGDGTTAPAASQAITVKFRDLTGFELDVRLKPTTPLRRAMDAYAARTSRDRLVLRFRFDSDPVNNDSTPESLEMEDGDVIDVFTEQIGGGGTGRACAEGLA